jgi:hypothetical protein
VLEQQALDPGIVRDELRSQEARKRDLKRALGASNKDSSGN